MNTRPRRRPALHGSFNAAIALAELAAFVVLASAALQAPASAQEGSGARRSEIGEAVTVATPSSFVRPFIGTGGHGHTYPGATVPFGMVQLSPDNGRSGWDWCSGYHASDTTLIGFSHTHLSGTGCADFGDILFMPTTAFRSVDRRYRSPFSHTREHAVPGYYRVHLLDNNIHVELSATRRAGIHRYTFPKTDSARVIIDLGYGQDDQPIECGFRIVNDSTIAGWRVSKGWARRQRIWFHTVFSRPIRSVLASADNQWTSGAREAHGIHVIAVLSFGAMDGQLLARTGISAVDADGARANLAAEIPSFDFEHVRTDAAAAWDNALGAITVDAPKDVKETFATALYHSMLAPTLYCDADGRYRGGDDSVHTANGFEHYSTFSLWDTFRAEHPLYTILDTKRVADWVRSLIAFQHEHGLLPVWTLQANETNCMIGYNAVPVVADAVLKGIPGIDPAEALEAMKASAFDMQRGLQFYNATRPMPFERAPAGDARKKLARARSSYRGAALFLNGYASRVSGEVLGYHSSHPKANEALLARATDGTMSIEWKTQTVPANFHGGAVTFVWLAGMASGKGAHGFDLFVNGQRTLTFSTAATPAQKLREFMGADGSRLLFRATYVDGFSDLFGTMALTLPASLLTPGAPVTLKVTGENGKSWDWYMTFQYALEPAMAVGTEPGLVLDKAQERQLVRVTLEHLEAPAALNVAVRGEKISDVLEPGSTTLLIPVPPVQHDTVVDVSVSLDGRPAATLRLPMQPARALGYVPADKENESVSKTLEYAFDDWCIAQTAHRLGRRDDAQLFDERAEYFRNLFDPATGFMRGRTSDGAWRSPFNPRFSTLKQHEYTEGNAWQYTWFVPHNVPALISLMGGRAGFDAKLDSLFAQSTDLEGTGATEDVSGLIGMYAHGNEPSHHIAYLYAFAGKPYKTQALVRRIMREFYHDAPDGLAGNEDCGQMSAWYVLSACGFYPVNPASGVYVLGSPVVSRADIRTAAGTVFTVRAEEQSDANVYVQSAELNGVPLTRAWIAHDEILRGGTLVLRMGAAPNPAWGAAGDIPGLAPAAR